MPVFHIKDIAGNAGNMHMYIAGTMPARYLCREHIFSNQKISNAIFFKNMKYIEFAAIDKKCGNMKPIDMYKKLFH